MNMISRIAPEGGYDNEEKDAYRRKVWESLKLALEAHPHVGQFLIMPSLEGVEIDLAISLGIPAHRIVAIDRDPRVLDKGKWRERHPDVICVASELADFGKVYKNQICCANLDLCGRFGDETVRTVVEFLVSNQKKCLPFFFSVTIAKGREDSTTFMLLKAMSQMDSKRLGMGRRFYKIISDLRMATLLTLVSKQADPYYHWKWLALDQGSYVSGRHPMTWCTLRIGRKEHQSGKRDRQLAKRDEKIIEMFKGGSEVPEIVTSLDLTRTTVYRVLQTSGLLGKFSKRKVMQDRLNAAFANFPLSIGPDRAES